MNTAMIAIKMRHRNIFSKSKNYDGKGWIHSLSPNAPPNVFGTLPSGVTPLPELAGLQPCPSPERVYWKSASKPSDSWLPN